MHSDPTPPGPTLLWMWGEIKGEFGSLRSLTLSNRQAVLDQMDSLHRRQDDMRRETLYHVTRIDRMLSSPKPKPSTTRWLARLPWDKLVSLVAGGLGILGYLKPEWVRLLTWH